VIASAPPPHRTPAAPATRLPPLFAGSGAPRAEDWTGDAGGRRGAHRIDDASTTEPSMARFDLAAEPPASAPPAAAGARRDGARPWSSGLASRVDAVLKDEWSNETPVVPPRPSELRALLGAPDPTRQQSIGEIEALHRAAEELHSDPELLVPPPRRVPHPTSEVDPDQIEAAIELAPPARRPPSTIAAGKPRKPK
jgi:hypothetical protein